MFMAVLFVITKTQKQCKWPAICKWIKKLWNIHTMKYYSKKKKSCNNTEENLQEARHPLSKKKEKIICSMIPFIQNSRKYEINYSDTKQINDFLGVWGRDKREDFFLE